jgi:hypothetical protein
VYGKLLEDTGSSPTHSQKVFGLMSTWKLTHSIIIREKLEVDTEDESKDYITTHTHLLPPASHASPWC